jgi:hypothetical protein
MAPLPQLCVSIRVTSASSRTRERAQEAVTDAISRNF